MPAGSKAAKAESALKAEAAKKGMTGRKADMYIYGAMNIARLCACLTRCRVR